jgi:hypothetical protein
VRVIKPQAVLPGGGLPGFGRNGKPNQEKREEL